ncbi:hypothetical protein PR048_023345 [Dryococelus australis]|uniref:Uncharacterized protein n=1 Tax=Dryococelus australis TaxID=614101 RepID=A0ABQ9GTT8_9NEOP|nr:hypothetical protein PR048_023345 [Dryococelus australis]
MCVTFFIEQYGQDSSEKPYNGKNHQKASSALSECPSLKVLFAQQKQCFQRSQLPDAIKPSTSTADETVNRFIQEQSLPETAKGMCG